MIEDLSSYLSECNIEVVGHDHLTLPTQKEGEHKIVIVPSYNLVEMMEEIIDGKSLAAYVNNKLNRVQQLTVIETFAKIVESHVLGTEFSSDLKEVEEFDELYRIYSSFWEGNELLEETIMTSDTEPFEWNESWIERRQEEDEGVIILTLPEEAGYEAPLWVPMGGYNECPLPEYQAVIFKHYQQKYKLKALAVSEDTWILQAAIRPETHEEALRLAKEHFIFCQYVLEGFSSIGHYADYLMKHNIWFFWWD
ncbi:DUF4253 domain-containing protein [Neobacillus mesonae]|nr:DUF4253 domain-containing protein [Neobacillus mesonae]